MAIGTFPVHSPGTRTWRAVASDRDPVRAVLTTADHSSLPDKRTAQGKRAAAAITYTAVLKMWTSCASGTKSVDLVTELQKQKQ